MDLAHDRRGQGEPLLLLHGIGGEKGIWAPVLDALSREREVIAVDLPGFGESRRLDGVQTPAALAAAVAGFLDGLGLERVHVAGNSLGGALALELVRAGRARSATALSPAGFWNELEWRRWIRPSLRLTVAVPRAALPALEVALGFAAGRALLTGQMTARPWRMPPDVAVPGARALATCTGFEATLEGFEGYRFAAGGPLPDVPVTVAWGRRDRLLLPREAARARRALPRARHMWLDGCGHVPMSDDPDQVARVLLEGSASG